MSDYLLDSSVQINALRRSPHTQTVLGNLVLSHRLCGCDVTIREVYAGMRPHEQQNTEAFLQSLYYLPTSRAIAELAGQWQYQYRRTGTQLSLPDVLIAATAYGHGAVLLTAGAASFQVLTSGITSSGATTMKVLRYVS